MHREQKTRLYCDDLLGVCLKIHVQQHILMATQVIQSLMGPTSVAAHKTMTGRCLDFIGWSVDSATIGSCEAQLSESIVFVYFCERRRLAFTD